MNATVGLAASAVAIAVLVAAQSELRFPLVAGAAVALALVGAAANLLARWRLPKRLVGRRRALRVAGALVAALGAVLLHDADPRLDGLPASPLMVPLLGIPAPLGAAVGAAGILWLARDKALARRLMLVGAIWLAAAVAFPVTVGGELTVPLAARAGTGAGTLTLALFAVAGAALLLRLLGDAKPKAPLLNVAAGGLLALFPLWLLGRDELAAAACTLAAEGLVSCAILACLAPVPERAPDDPLPAAEHVAVIAIALVWWLVEIHGFGYAVDDQYIYYYGAQRWAHGGWPYRDFFFSHPPLHLAVPALLFRVFGFHLALAKLIAPSAVFAAGLLLWRWARRHFGAVAGAVTFGLFLFSIGALRAASTFTGIELTTLFLCAGLVAALDRRSFAAGLWFGASACAGVYGVAGFATFGVLACAAPPRPGAGRATRWDAVRMLAGFALVFASINLLFWAIGGARFLDGVYRYHFLKPSKSPDTLALSSGPHAIVYDLFVLLGGRDLRGHLSLHAIWYLAALAAPVLVVAARKISWRPRSWWPTEPRGVLAPGAIVLLSLALLGVLAELGVLRERFEFYFTLTVPFLALLGGWAIAQLSARPIWIAALLALAVPVTAWSTRTAYPQETGPTETYSYEWRPSPVLPALGEVAHALFWAGTRQRGDSGSSVAHYLWSEKRNFDTAPEIAAYLEAHTTPEDAITGSSDLAPLVALLSHRRLAGDQIDTNGKVFATGVVPERDFWASVCKDRVAYLVLGLDTFWTAPAMPEHLVAGSFELERTFVDHGIKQRRSIALELWRRVHDPPDPICEGL